VIGQVDVDIVGRVVGAVPGELDPFPADVQGASVLEVSVGAGLAGSSSRSSSRRVSSCPMRTTPVSNSEDAPAWSAWWWE
jgi:hypothetical protein